MKIHRFLDMYLSGPLVYQPHVNRRPWRAKLNSDLEGKSLNGTWDFAYFDSYKDADIELNFEEGHGILEPLSYVDEILWPAQWELSGYGKPKYINQDYEWAASHAELKPPFIPPEAIRLGIYQKTVDFPVAEGHFPILQLDGFEAAVWIFDNGEFIGYSNQGKNRNEFFLKKDTTNHQLTILMTSLSSGSWMECQDMWRMSGAIRDITITSVPEIELLDLRLDSSLSEDTADLFAEIKVWNHTEEMVGPQTAHVTLVKDNTIIADAEGFTGNLSYRFEEKRFRELPEPVESGVISTIYVKLQDIEPELWHPETPELYEVQVHLEGSNDTYKTKFGFREFASTHGVFLMNGKPLKVQGVNRHEFDPAKGRAIDPSLAKTDLKLMKASNLNAVRVAHYPARDELYEVADEMGMLVMDEANIESHGISYRRNVLPGNDARWYPMAFDRVSAILETHKNHPSVFSWSIGNELGWGETVQELASFLRAKEDGRLLHKRQMNKVADFNSENYGRPEFFESFALDPELENKIFLSTEYAHAMGNSMGDIARYIHIFKSHPNLAGGFVWEWCDHALLDSELRPLYGGQFGEERHDGNFCIDGVTTAWREDTEKLRALRQAWSYFELGLEDTSLSIRSRLQVLPAEGLELHLSWLANGREVFRESHECPSIKPGESATFDIEMPEFAANDEVYFTAKLVVPEDKREGFFRQITETDDVLLTYQKRHQNPTVTPILKARSAIQDLGSGVFRSDTGIELSFNEAGALSIDGKFTDLDLSLARAVTDNDRRSTDYLGLQGVHRGWREAKLAQLVFRLEEGPVLQDDAVILTRSVLLDDEPWLRLSQRFEVLDRELKISNDLQRVSGEELPLPRAGLKFKPEGLAETYWYGGSGEAYADRRGESELGLFYGKNEDLFNWTYLKPQENGRRDSLRYLLLAEDETVGYALRMDENFSFNRQPWPVEVLEETASVCELEEKAQEDTVYVDVEHAGLGNRSCGPETASWHKLTKERYQWKLYVDFEPEGMSVEAYAEEWQWPEDMTYRDFAEDTSRRETGGTDAREQLASRGASQYRDPSDRDVREEQGF